jgi:hypothetical protein
MPLNTGRSRHFASIFVNYTVLIILVLFIVVQIKHNSMDIIRKLFQFSKSVPEIKSFLRC